MKKREDVKIFSLGAGEGNLPYPTACEPRQASLRSGSEPRPIAQPSNVVANAM